MITIGLSLTVFSKFSLVRSSVATAGHPFKKGLQCTLDTHVRRPVRAFAHRAVAFRLPRGRARELARRARGARTVVRAHRGSRPAAPATRRGRFHPANARPSWPILGWT